MNLRITTLIILASLATLTSLSPVLTSKVEGSDAIDPQRRPSSRVKRSPPAASSALDYSKFLHSSHSHQQACSTCHKAPTANWRPVRDFPDVADYPGHNACVNCHRQEFFRGARPAICAICHVKVSPRDEGRFAFRNPEHPRQFTIEFPHDKHQDVIAALRSMPDRASEAATDHIAGASRRMQASLIRSAHVVDDKQKVYNNCSICHGTNQKPLVSPPGGWPDQFVPSNDTFKTVPLSHVSCFNCHWKAQEPTRENCAGCHKVSQPFRPAVWRGRISLKFTHVREQHIAECTTCHINITKASTLRGLKPDVPVTSCAPCHKTSTDKSIVTMEIEMDRRKQNPHFTCTKCHTSEIGGKTPPASHFALFVD